MSLECPRGGGNWAARQVQKLSRGNCYPVANRCLTGPSGQLLCDYRATIVRLSWDYRATIVQLSCDSRATLVQLSCNSRAVVLQPFQCMLCNVAISMVLTKNDELVSRNWRPPPPPIKTVHMAKESGFVCHKSRSLYAIKVGSYTRFSVKTLLFQGSFTPYDPSFYGMFWEHIFLRYYGGLGVVKHQMFMKCFAWIAALFGQFPFFVSSCLLLRQIKVEFWLCVRSPPAIRSLACRVSPLLLCSGLVFLTVPMFSSKSPHVLPPPFAATRGKSPNGFSQKLGFSPRLDFRDLRVYQINCIYCSKISVRPNSITFWKSTRTIPATWAFVMCKIPSTCSSFPSDCEDAESR